MSSRLTTIQQIARKIEAHFANVSDNISRPTLEEDMQDVAVAIFGCHSMDEVLCGN